MSRKVRDLPPVFCTALKLLITLPALTMGLVIETQAEVSWPEFRGLGGQGHASNNDVPLHWSESENIEWKTTIPGRGWSTPVVCQDQLWMTTASEDVTKLYVVSVDSQSGNILQNQLLFSVFTPQSIHDLNSYASPSPVIKPGRVYVHFGTYGSACLDTQSGEVVWSRRDIELQHLLFMVSDNDVGTCLDAGSGETHWTKRLGGNFSASPIHAAGRIYLCDHEGTTSVFAPHREFRLLATNTLDGGYMASPIVVGSAIYLRTRSHLYGIATSLQENRG